MRTDVKRRGWTISAEGNDLADRFLESVFFTGNGRMGARGYPAYRPIRRPLDAGLFLAGFYDRISDSTELTDFVNLPTPIWYQIRLNGRIPAIPSHLSRALDLRTGLLTFRYRLSIADDWVDVQEQRFFSLAKPSFLFQRLEFQGRGQVELLAGIDHQSCNSPIPDDQVKENTQIIQMTRFCSGEATDAGFTARYKTNHTRLELAQTVSCRTEGFSSPAFVADTGDGVGVRCTSDASDALIALEIAARLTSSRDVDPLLQLDVEPGWDFVSALAENQAAWEQKWADCDIVMEGDDDAQTALRYVIYPSMQAIAGHESGLGVPMILGAQIVGGVVAIIVGFSIKKIRKLFPPLIAGTVVFTIGLSLYPTAVNYMAGGAGKPLASEIGKLGFGSWQNWTTALITLAVVTVLNHFTKGILKLASILIGVIVGYVVALGFGLVDFSGVASAGLFQFPTPMHFGVVFDPSSCIAIGLLFAINSIQAIGDFSATTTGSMDRMPEDKELQGGIVGYGISNIIGAVLGGLPTATYSQNVGIVVTTKVINRIVLGMAAVILLVAGLIPKFSAVLTTIPQCVLGGATITVFASIAMTGIKLVMTEDMNYRNTSIVGLSVALGMGVTQIK